MEMGSVKADGSSIAFSSGYTRILQRDFVLCADRVRVAQAAVSRDPCTDGSVEFEWKTSGE